MEGSLPKKRERERERERNLGRRMEGGGKGVL